MGKTPDTELTKPDAITATEGEQQQDMRVVPVDDVKKMWHDLNEQHRKEVDALKGQVSKDLNVKVTEIVKEIMATQHEQQRNDPRRIGNPVGFDAGDVGLMPLHDSIIDRADPSAGKMLVRDAIAHEPELSPQPELAAKLHDLNDTVLFLNSISSAKYKDQMEQWDIRQTNPYKMLQMIGAQYTRALDTATAAGGLEFIPTDFSATLEKKLRLMGKVSGLFRTIPMPTETFKLPVEGTDATAYLLGEPLYDAETAIKASTPGTANISLTAVRLLARTLWSEDFAEGSVIPAIPFVRDMLAAAHYTATEQAILNGDTTATHMDTGETVAVTDARRAWKGLRRWACTADSSDTLTSTFTASLNSTKIGTLLKVMGKYGVNSNEMAFIGGPSIAHQFRDLEELQTLDKYGPNASILTGEAGKWNNIPIIISEFVKENLNASGIFDDSVTDNTILYAVWRPGWVLGQRTAMKIDSQRKITTDQVEMVCKWRGDFKPVFTPATAGNKIVACGVDIATA